MQAGLVSRIFSLKPWNCCRLVNMACRNRVGDTVRTRFEDPAIEAGRRLLSTSVGGRGLPPGIQQGIGGSLAGMIRHPDEAALDFAGIAAPMLGHAPPALMRQSGATGAIGDPTEAWRYLKYRAREGLKSWEQT